MDSYFWPIDPEVEEEPLDEAKPPTDLRSELVALLYAHGLEPEYIRVRCIDHCIAQISTLYSNDRS